MNHKKTVNDAVRAANQVNAQSSTGPRTEKGKSATSHNALRHGILTRKVVLDPAEVPDYQRVWQSWNDYYQPKGELEQVLVEEVTNTSWKLGITEGLETRELSKRTFVRNGIGVSGSSFGLLPAATAGAPILRVVRRFGRTRW